MRMVVAIGACMVSAMAADLAAAAAVRLRPKATIDHGMVLLGDVADVIENDADRARRLAAIELEPAPEPSETSFLSMKHLRDRLTRRGVDVSAIDFAGADRVEIHRLGADQPDASNEAPKAHRGVEEWEGKIAGLIAQNVEQSTGLRPDQFELVTRSRTAAEMLAGSGAKEFDLIVPTKWLPGNHSVHVESTGPAGPIQSRIQVQLAFKRRWIASMRSLKKGDRIAAGDLGFVERVEWAEADRLVTDAAVLVGCEAIRPIEADRPISLDDVRTPRLVYRGNPITVTIRSGQATVQAIALAQADGGLGDWIDVVNASTKEPLQQQVRITGVNVGEMPENAPPSLLAARATAAASTSRRKDALRR